RPRLVDCDDRVRRVVEARLGIYAVGDHELAGRPPRARDSDELLKVGDLNPATRSAYGAIVLQVAQRSSDDLSRTPQRFRYFAMSDRRDHATAQRRLSRIEQMGRQPLPNRAKVRHREGSITVLQAPSQLAVEGLAEVRL